MRERFFSATSFCPYCWSILDASEAERPLSVVESLLSGVEDGTADMTVESIEKPDEGRYEIRRVARIIHELVTSAEQVITELRASGTKVVHEGGYTSVDGSTSHAYIGSVAVAREEPPEAGIAKSWAERWKNVSSES